MSTKPNRPAASAPESEAARAVPVPAVFRESIPSTSFRPDDWNYGVARGAQALTPRYPTLLHALSAVAKASPQLGITLLPEEPSAPEEFRSYTTLYEQARSVATALLARGFKPGERALLVLPTSFDFVIAFFAVQIAGGIPVPAYPPTPLEKPEEALERLRHLVRYSGVTLCLTSPRLRPRLGGVALGVSSLRELVTVESLLSDRALAAKVKAFGKDAACIHFSSGSTASPRGVLLSHRNVVANLHAIGEAMQVRASDVVVSWLPLTHDVGLTGVLLMSVYWHLPLVLLSPTAFFQQPRRWLEALTRFKGTLSPTPNAASALAVKRLTPKDLAGLDLSSWRLAIAGAEPINLRTVRDFAQAFAAVGFDARAVYPIYSLVEATMAVTAPALGPAPAQAVRHLVVDRAALADGRVLEQKGVGTTAVVSCGTPIPGHEVLVVDEKGRPRRDRTVGHVVVRGPSVMQGYFDNDSATARVLKAGWLWTGDLGFFDAGELFVTGRAKDLLVVRGKNFYAEDLERIAERLAGVRGGGVVAFGIYDEQRRSELAVLVAETSLTSDADRTALAAQLAQRLSAHAGLEVDEVVLVPPRTIPKTSSGKRQRAVARELYLKHALAPPKTGRLGLALVYARSGAGLLSLLRKRLRNRREPD